MTHRFSDAAAEDCWRTCYPLQAPEEQQDPKILDSQVRYYTACCVSLACKKAQLSWSQLCGWSEWHEEGPRKLRCVKREMGVGMCAEDQMV